MTETNKSIFKTKKITRSGDDIVEEEMINEELARRYLGILEMDAENEKRRLELEEKRVKNQAPWWVALLVWISGSFAMGRIVDGALSKFRTPRMENLGTEKILQQIPEQARSQFMNYESS